MKRWVREGAPYILVVALTAAGFLGLLAAAALRGDEGIRGYAHIRMTAENCEVDQARSRDAVTCHRVGQSRYVVSFARSLEGRAVVATRETCCPGAIYASVQSDRNVLVVLSPGPFPVVAYVAAL
jgi:hypothetical protein